MASRYTIKINPFVKYIVDKKSLSLISFSSLVINIKLKEEENVIYTHILIYITIITNGIKHYFLFSIIRNNKLEIIII